MQEVYTRHGIMSKYESEVSLKASVFLSPPASPEDKKHLNHVIMERKILVCVPSTIHPPTPKNKK